MMRRSIFFAFFSTALIVFLVGATAADAQTYSGQGTAARVTVTAPLPAPVLTTAVADTGPLPSAGGNITLTSAGVTIPGVVAVGDATVNTSGGSNTSQSLASVNSLGVLVGNGITISAGVVASNTSCSCPFRACTGTSTVANLTVADANGNSIVIDGTAAPNTTIDIEALGGLVIGTVIVNEQITSPGSITVNAIHVRLTIAGVVTDIIVASAHSDITCITPPAITAYSGRATGIRNRDFLILGTDITTLVSDTGFLPTSGGKINVSTVGMNPVILPGLLTSGTVTSNTAGGVQGSLPPPPITDVNSSASDSTVEGLNLNVAGILALSATTVHSETRCTCGIGGSSTCTGSSTIVNGLISVPLLGLNIPIAINPPANSGISLTLPLGLGSIIIRFNEQTPVSPTTLGFIDVNALHVILNVPGIAVSDTIIASSHSDIDCGVIPSAANVSVSGQVRDSRGRGIARVNVTTTDGTGATRRVTTNSFGYYTFEDLPSGQMYVFNASHKLFTFEPLVVSVDDNLTGLDFTPVNNGKR